METSANAGELQVAEVAALPLVPVGLTRDQFDEVVRDWEKSKSEKTRMEYSRDLDGFAAFMSSPNRTAAVWSLVTSGPAWANLQATRYKNHLSAPAVEGGKRSKLAPSTINRRLTALKSAVGFFKRLGFIGWDIGVALDKAEPRRDTSGPGRVVEKIIMAADTSTLKGLRDRVIVRFCYSMLLRRSSVVGMDVKDVDVEKGTVAVTLKGHKEKKRKPVPPKLLSDLKAYLAARGNPDKGPLIANLDRAKKGDGRLTGEGVRLAIADLCEKAGIGRVRPHGLRHQGATDLATITNGNLVIVRDAGDWADFRTPSRYVNREGENQRTAYQKLDLELSGD